MSWLGNELVKQIHALLKKKHALFYHFHPAGEKLDGLDFPANETTTKCKKGNWKNQKETKKSISLCRERMRVNGSFDGIDDDLLATLGRICPRSENKSNQERERENSLTDFRSITRGVSMHKYLAKCRENTCTGTNRMTRMKSHWCTTKKKKKKKKKKKFIFLHFEWNRIRRSSNERQRSRRNVLIDWTSSTLKLVFFWGSRWSVEYRQTVFLFCFFFSVILVSQNWGYLVVVLLMRVYTFFIRNCCEHPRPSGPSIRRTRAKPVPFRSTRWTMNSFLPFCRCVVTNHAEIFLKFQFLFFRFGWNSRVHFVSVNVHNE